MVQSGSFIPNCNQSFESGFIIGFVVCAILAIIADAIFKYRRG